MKNRTETYSTRTNMRVADILSQIEDETYYDLDLTFDEESEYSTQFSILSDLEYALDIVTKLMEIKITDDKEQKIEGSYSDKDFLVKRSLLITAVITYCRCFGKTKGRTSNLSTDKIFSDLPEFLSEYRLIDFHEKLKTIRNEFFAHAGKSEWETYKTKVKFRVINRTEVEIKLEPTIIAIYTLDNKELEIFFILLKQLVKQTREKFEKISNDFFKNLTQEKIKEAIELKARSMHAR